MGLLRKTISLSMPIPGMGVKFRSNREKIARNTKKTARELQRQTRMMEGGMSELPPPPPSGWPQHQPVPTVPPPPPAPVTQGPPPGWYNDPGGQPVQRWWDGAAWSEHTQPVP